MKKKINENTKITLTVKQLRNLVKEATTNRFINEDHDIEIPDDAVKVISDRAIELLGSLGRSAYVLLYLLEPSLVAIGITDPTNTIKNIIENRVWDWVEHDCPRDGNYDYDLRSLYDAIKSGKL